MFTSVAQANDAVIERIRNARPHWLDVQPAGSLIEALNKNRTLLHAGPPMRWQAHAYLKAGRRMKRRPTLCSNAAKSLLFPATT